VWRLAEGNRVEFRVLGPVELWIGERPVDLGSRKELCVLAALLLAVGRTVSADWLAECVWGEDQPPSARETLQVYISRIRKRLRDAGADAAVISSTLTQGYRIAVPAEGIDLRRFESLVKQADGLAAAAPEAAVELLREACALFRGEPLAGLSGEWAQATRTSLVERERAVSLRRIELELRLGRHDGLISELTGLTARGPVDQKAVGLLMTALYNSGRTAEALAVYRDTRARLRASLGFEPSRDLQDLHQRMLNGDPGLGPAREETPQPANASNTPTTAVTSDTLGPDQRRFVGRDEDLHALLAHLEHDARAGFSAPVVVVDGMPGVGKTTLALHAAHLLRDKYPDGTLQLGLRGHDPRQEPMKPTEALVTLLSMIGRQLSDLQQFNAQETLSALWRAHTASRRILLLLDDAHDADQVRPLLPTSPGCAVLVTSRARLSSLDSAHAHMLGPMPAAEAARLFSEHVGADRADDPEAVQEVAKLCADLPLAVVVAAGHLRSRPAWTVRDLAQRMAYTRNNPDEGDQLGQPVNAAFALSYRSLAPDHQRLFRGLGLHQGNEFSLHAAAALHGAPAADTDRALDVLVGHNLLDEPVRNRYRMHDLLRGYASQRAHIEDSDEDRELAQRRLFDYYLYVADRAERVIQPWHRRSEPLVHHKPRDIPRLSCPDEANAWLAEEHTNLLTAIRHADAHGFRRHATQLPEVLGRYLDRRGCWKQAVEVHEIALGACYGLGDRPGQARALTDLGRAHWRLGDLESARVCAETALELWRDLGDQAGEADALFQLGRIHWHARRPAQAESRFRAAAVLRGRLNDQRGRAVADYHLAIIVFELGRHAEGIARMSAALETAREIHDYVSERDCLTNLGEMHQRLGQTRDARRCFQQAMTLARLHADPQRLAVLANNIGAVYSSTGDHAAALECFNEALETHVRMGDRRNEFDTLVNIAEVFRALGRPADALDHLERATALADGIGDPLLHAHARHTSGMVLAQQGNRDEALQSYRTALAFARKAAAPLERAKAHERIGDLLAESGEAAMARTQWRKALALYEELELPEAESVRERLRGPNTDGER
jgi:DNA-binding SARP family transcriptional activator/tetratricopeptide (TPR) repeat protein